MRGTGGSDLPGGYFSSRKELWLRIFQRTGTRDHQGSWNPVCDRKILCPYFFRNSINNGLLLIEQPDLYDDMEEGKEIAVQINHQILYQNRAYPIASLPENLVEIIQAGGLVKAIGTRKRNGMDG